MNENEEVIERLDKTFGWDSQGSPSGREGVDGYGSSAIGHNQRDKTVRHTSRFRGEKQTCPECGYEITLETDTKEKIMKCSVCS